VSLQQPISRRRAITAGAAGVGALVLAGCSAATKASKKSSSGAASSPATPSPKASSAGATLGKLSDVPVGGSVAAKGADGSPVLVAQPVAGQVVAFSAICTHQGCTVAPAGKELHCPCHGSVYDAATGTVKSGPAPKPLSKLAVHVAAGNIVTGA